MTMSKTIDVAVIGCGVFGAEVALMAKSLGLTVMVYEAKAGILSGASANNQNRLHLGFHYPRDLNTGRQSIRGFAAFKAKYAPCIQDNFPNAYFIANENSLTSPDGYLKFCDLLGARYERVSPRDFPVQVQGADVGILCDEVVYDCGILRDLVRERLRCAEVEVALRERVLSVVRVGEEYRINSEHRSPVLAKVVINASYGDINRLTAGLGHRIKQNLYEYTAVPIIRLNMPKVGVTIMDGPFMTVLPYGKSDHFLLYDVEHTVIAKEVASQMDLRWADPTTGPFAAADKQNYFKKMIASCKQFVPALERAESAGFLEGPRMVLARREASDERPSFVTAHDDRSSYFTVFAGKIDHCIWVAEEVGGHLRAKFNL